MKVYAGHHFFVTDEEIRPSGKVEFWFAHSRKEAIEHALYTHRLHDGRAWVSEMGVIRCPLCGTQIAIVKSKNGLMA